MKAKNVCISVTVNFINTCLVLLFTLPVFFILLYLIGITLDYSGSSHDLFNIIVTLIEVVPVILFTFLAAYFLSIQRINRNIKVKRCGNVIHATVLDYVDDAFLINERNIQKIKLSVITEEGSKTLLYNTYDTKKKYEIGSDIELLNYKNYYLIKDEKAFKREKAIIGIIAFVFLFSLFWVYITSYMPLINNVSLHDIKMIYTEKTHKDVRYKFNNLSYDVPDDLKLSTYQKNWNYRFSLKNTKGKCYIDILSFKITDNDKTVPVDGCEFYDIDNKFVSYEEKTINNLMWCYEYKETDYGSIREEYRKNDGEYYYDIALQRYNDDDETCLTYLNIFMNTVKIEKN